MGASNTEHYSARQKSIATIAKALGHPARVAIIDHLLKKRSCICGDIVDELPLSQPTVSQHLKELKSAGLIKGEVEGSSICYCLDENAVIKLRNYMDALLSKHERNECC